MVMETARREFDYVIIGAGSAGCALAYRLTEDGSNVLLLEAGGWDRDPWIHIPLGWGQILLKRLHDWMYFAEPEAGVNGRGIECARGRVVGGSSSINAMAYVRGHKADYDRWAASGLPDWSFEHVLPYFKKQESWEKGDDAFRGGDGPLTTQECKYADPLIEAYFAAGGEAGFPSVADYNGPTQEGFGRWQMTIRDGRRCSAAVAYLRPALHRKNLTVETHALASRILMEGNRATGVEYTRRGEKRVAYAAREVILAGGVINSPQLLMLSGIGPAAALQAHGIVPVIDLPGVGQNLQDHMSVAVFYKRKGAGPLLRKMRFDRIGLELLKTYFFGKGITNDVPSGAMAFLRTSADEAVPDMQILFNAAPLTAKPYFSPVIAPYMDGFAARVVGLRPESRGTVELASADPDRAPIIRQNFFTSEKDIVTLRNAVRIARKIGAQPALQPYIDKELAPGPNVDSDEAIDAYIRATAITVHHPLGTCRMGPASDPLAVVDHEMKVRGAEGLRLVDASVMPDLVGGNINAAVLMIAEKAADMIRGRAPLERRQRQVMEAA